jgi:hypothetical protein
VKRMRHIVRMRMNVVSNDNAIGLVWISDHEEVVASALNDLLRSRRYEVWRNERAHNSRRMIANSSCSPMNSPRSV